MKQNEEPDVIFAHLMEVLVKPLLGGNPRGEDLVFQATFIYIAPRHHCQWLRLWEIAYPSLIGKNPSVGALPRVHNKAMSLALAAYGYSA